MKKLLFAVIISLLFVPYESHAGKKDKKHIAENCKATLMQAQTPFGNEKVKQPKSIFGKNKLLSLRGFELQTLIRPDTKLSNHEAFIDLMEASGDVLNYEVESRDFEKKGVMSLADKLPDGSTLQLEYLTDGRYQNRAMFRLNKITLVKKNGKEIVLNNKPVIDHGTELKLDEFEKSRYLWLVEQSERPQGPVDVKTKVISEEQTKKILKKLKKNEFDRSKDRDLFDNIRANYDKLNEADRKALNELLPQSTSQTGETTQSPELKIYYAPVIIYGPVLWRFLVWAKHRFDPDLIYASELRLFKANYDLKQFTWFKNHPKLEEKLKQWFIKHPRAYEEFKIALIDIQVKKFYWFKYQPRFIRKFLMTKALNVYGKWTVTIATFAGITFIMSKIFGFGIDVNLPIRMTFPEKDPVEYNIPAETAPTLSTVSGLVEDMKVVSKRNAQGALEYSITLSEVSKIIVITQYGVSVDGKPPSMSTKLIEAEKAPAEYEQALSEFNSLSEKADSKLNK